MMTQKKLIDLVKEGETLLQMPSTKIQGFLNEYPWVKKYVKGDIVQVHVARIDPSILTRDLERVETSLDPFSSDLRYEQAFLLDSDGELVDSVTESTIMVHKYWLFGPKVTKTFLYKVSGFVYRDSIQNRLCRLGEQAKRVQYILSYYPHATNAVILHKSPKGISVPEWIQ